MTPFCPMRRVARPARPAAAAHVEDARAHRNAMRRSGVLLEALLRRAAEHMPPRARTVGAHRAMGTTVTATAARRRAWSRRWRRTRVQRELHRVVAQPLRRRVVGRQAPPRPATRGGARRGGRASARPRGAPEAAAGAARRPCRRRRRRARGRARRAGRRRPRRARGRGRGAARHARPASRPSVGCRESICAPPTRAAYHAPTDMSEVLGSRRRAGRRRGRRRRLQRVEPALAVLVVGRAPASRHSETRWRYARAPRAPRCGARAC